MLTVNKNHIAASFNKKRKPFFIKIGIFMLIASLYSGMTAYCVEALTNTDYYVSVSEDARSSIYENPFFEDLHYSIENDLNSDASLVDLNITEKNLENVQFLELDMSKNLDLSFLQYCKELETITIINGDLLTQADLETLNRCNARRIELFFSINHIAYSENKLDFSGVDGSRLSIYIDNSKRLFTGEMKELVVYNWVNSLPPSIEITGIDDKKMELINHQLDKFIDNIDFSKCITTEDRILKIIDAIVSHIEYDQVITDKSVGYLEIIDYYNKNSLSSVLNFEASEEVTGCCANYSSLFNAVCYKLGIECYQVIAETVNGEDGHGWNLVKLGDKYIYVDLTASDNEWVNTWFDYVENAHNILESPNLPDEIVVTLKNNLIQNLNDIRKNVFFELDGHYSFDYTLHSDIDGIINKIEKGKLIYYNTTIDGESTNSFNNMILPSIIVLDTGLIIAFAYSQKQKNNKLGEISQIKKS